MGSYVASSRWRKGRADSRTNVKKNLNVRADVTSSPDKRGRTTPWSFRNLAVDSRSDPLDSNRATLVCTPGV
ncbi:unnamed protein product [Prunus armeniaca]